MSDVQKMELFDDIVKYVERLGGRVKYKSDSIFWRMTPKRIRRSGTTIGHTIWLAERGSKIVTLIHEISHLVDIKKTGRIRWLFEYLLPQSASLIWAVIAVVTHFLGYSFIPALIISIAWLILPLPSSNRVEKEYRAFTVSAYFKKQFYGELSDEYREIVIDNLCGWLYYKMIWRRSVAEYLFDTMDKRSNDYDMLVRHYPEVKDIEEIING